jgi:hypothetical protein
VNTLFKGCLLLAQDNFLTRLSELQGLVQDVTFMYITFTSNSTIDTDALILTIFTLQNVSMAVAEDCLQRLQLADIFPSPVSFFIPMISTVIGSSDSFPAAAFLPPPRQTAH